MFSVMDFASANVKEKLSGVAMLDKEILFPFTMDVSVASCVDIILERPI